jgi:purine-nucleoside phosphorylase
LTADWPIEGRLDFSEIPEMPAALVPGHAGAFTWGGWAGCRVLVSRGRVHLYEGHSARAVTAGIRFMASCGVKRIILTNAAGSLHPQHPPGAWMSITDQINLTGTSPLLGSAHFVEMNEIYSEPWRAHFAEAAEAEEVPLCRGVYVGLVGPQYETPAEVRMLRLLGGDAVGMSTVLEAIQARALGLEVVGFSCLTNWASGLSAEPLSHADVLSMGNSSGAPLARVLKRGLLDSTALKK